MKVECTHQKWSSTYLTEKQKNVREEVAKRQPKLMYIADLVCVCVCAVFPYFGVSVALPG